MITERQDEEDDDSEDARPTVSFFIMPAYTITERIFRAESQFLVDMAANIHYAIVAKHNRRVRKMIKGTVKLTYKDVEIAATCN